MEENIGKLDERIEELEASVNVCSDRVIATEHKLISIGSVPHEVTPVEHDGLKKMIHETMREVNDLEQYGRRYNIRIFGLDIKENCMENVVTFIRDNLSMDLSLSDVENAHPLPYKTGSGPSKPSVIVRLRSRGTRDEILQRRKILKGTGVSISEDLTKNNIQLMNRLRADERVDSTWSYKWEDLLQGQERYKEAASETVWNIEWGSGKI